MDVEANALRVIHDIVDEVLATVEVENDIIEDLLLADDNDDIDIDDLGLAENGNVHDILEATLANIQLLEEEEEFLLEDDRRVREGRPLHVDIEPIRNLEDPTFYSNFRMDKFTFEMLVIAFGNHLVAKNRLIRLRTGLDICLLMVLWMLGNLCSFRGAGFAFGVSASVVHFHYCVVIEALRELSQRFIKWPSAAARDRTKQHCERKAGFPGVVGMMDGTLIKVTAPLIQANMFFDRKHQYSLSVCAVCDHRVVFTHVYVGESGRTHDARVFSRSPLHDILLEEPEALSPDEHILADSAYTLTDKVIIPYRHNVNLTRIQKRFNYFLSSIRMCIERAFGHLKEKWRRLYRLQIRNPDYALDHIMASFVLHNFVKLGGREPDGIHFAERRVVQNPDAVANPEREHPLLAAARPAGVQKREMIARRLTPN